MDPDNNIVFPNWQISLYLGFYHVESGYIFNMELAYKLDDTGRYNILTYYMSRAAPLNPFFGPKETLHFILNIATTIFVIYTCVACGITIVSAFLYFIFVIFSIFISFF